MFTVSGGYPVRLVMWLPQQLETHALQRLPSRPWNPPRPDSSVVERGPEKAGVGGSIPSLATTLINNLAEAGR
jgi:hypothetical protein